MSKWGAGRGRERLGQPLRGLAGSPAQSFYVSVHWPRPHFSSPFVKAASYFGFGREMQSVTEASGKKNADRGEVLPCGLRYEKQLSTRCQCELQSERENPGPDRAHQ